MFRCKIYSTIEIPKEKQPGFCAKRYRMGTDRFCRECEIGKEAARTETSAVRAGLPGAKPVVIKDVPKVDLPAEAVVLSSPVVTPREENPDMAEKKLCSCGKCGKGAVKDGLSTRCFKKKYGHLPYAKDNGNGKTKLKSSAPLKERIGTGPESECPHCAELEAQANEYLAIQNMFIAVGLITPEKVRAAREFVRL